jgi:hypothetical protein
MRVTGETFVRIGVAASVTTRGWTCAGLSAFVGA